MVTETRQYVARFSYGDVSDCIQINVGPELFTVYRDLMWANGQILWFLQLRALFCYFVLITDIMYYYM